MQDVVEARYVSEYILWLRFEDGTEGEIDLVEELHGPVFEPAARHSTNARTSRPDS